MDRRGFLRSTLGAALGAAAVPVSARQREGRRPRILLRNGWQSVNIGDVAHPLGVLALLERYVPEAEVRLWPSELGNGAAEVLAKRFPKLAILSGKEQVAAGIAECDFLLHGSGSGFVAPADVARWRAESGGKPYGVYGISFFGPKPETVTLLSGARFVFFRDSVSLKVAKEAGVKSPVMAFGPDSAFGVTDLRNDAAAVAFLRANGLEEGKFLCCIPRYRWTPYWLIKKGRAFDEAKDRRNREMQEHDHAPLREAIEAVTRGTDLKVLVCCEDMTQVELGKRAVVDPLPADVRKRVVWRDRYWMTDEALSTYVRSAGLFGNEMHSPIMCVASGVPAVVCRFAEQTTKGFMWRDIGLGDWLFDLDQEAEVRRIAPTVLAIAKDPAAARAKAATAREVVRKRQAETMGVVKENLVA
jgi:polysaccharide pyruvyl transferase WcaK-like protein